ncbi:LppA family lipoprotein [Mycobacterium camsae]|uniref:LppA family lipoprotein n=1 Tax=Mycobacterium gordonae TaxID=1778 RepID=UPI001F11DA51|nr:LppA family lipoprotein [Mycobacterium gordonae]
MTRRAVALLGIALTLAGCLKPTAWNPSANPGRSELDRLQRIVNARPDLEAVERQLGELDTAIRAVIGKHSPQSRFSSMAATHSTNGCDDPFTRSIGRQVNSDMFFADPPPAATQWLQIATELAPIFAAAGFAPNNSAPGSPPLPIGAANDSQIRDDGARVNLVSGGGGPLDYSYDTGCHLPGAWRTAPPPPDSRPANDPSVHYPYLYGSPGGRSVDAY